MEEEKLETCNKCNCEFDINTHDNSGYVGKNGEPTCAGCCEDYSL